MSHQPARSTHFHDVITPHEAASRRARHLASDLRDAVSRCEARAWSGGGDESADSIELRLIARVHAAVETMSHRLHAMVRALEASETLDFVGGGANVNEAFQWKRFRSGISALGVCFENSGVPLEWRATTNEPGLALVADDDDLRRLFSTVREEKRLHPSSTIVVSCHWGSNCGWHVTPKIENIAKRLVESGCDVVHGHSSHHPRRCELYENKLIMYGCGELLNDYEGIGDHEEFPASKFAGDLRFAYFPELDGSARRAFARMDIVVLRQTNCFALERANADAVERVHRALAPHYVLGGLRLDRDAREATLVATPAS